jgi:hypothetical protein
MQLLSTYSHLAMVMYRSDKQRFISSQLYTDSQTCVKNMFFCLTKQQLLDPTQQFYLFMKGSDGVEHLFAMMRMIGGHKPNVNILELCQNLGRGMDIQRIFAEHPEWYSGHRRLSTARGDKADHLSVRDWQGDVVAGSVDIKQAWDQGAADAQQILYQAGFTRAECNWVLIFATPDTDILRPFGDGIYVGAPSKNGTEDEPDRSLDESVELPDAADLGSNVGAALADERPDIDNHEGLDADDDSDTGSVIDNADLNELQGLDTPSSDGSFSLPDPTHADDELDLDPPSLTELVEMAEDEEQEDKEEDSMDTDQSGCGLDAGPSRKGRDDAHYVNFEGRSLHKATVIRVLLNSDYTKKQSKDRLQRVRTYTGAAVDAVLGIDEATRRDAFNIGDCFATLVRSGSDISLAIMRCTHVNRCGKPVKDSVPRVEVLRPEARITLQGQVLLFVELHQGLRVTRQPASGVGENTVVGEGEGEAFVDGEAWIWDHETVRLRPVKPSARAQDVLALTVHGFTTLLLDPPSGLVSLANDNTIPDPEDENAHLTWTFSRAELSGLLAQLWSTLKAPGTVSKLAQCGASARFPYRSVRGELIFLKHDSDWRC